MGTIYFGGCRRRNSNYPVVKIPGWDMEIRATTVADTSGVEALLCRSYPALMADAYEAGVLAQALPMMTRANPSLLASGTYYLVEIDGLVVGCGGWTFGEPGSGRTEPGLAHLRHFAVCPDRGRRGIGRTLYEKCLATAVQAGVARFQAFSSRNAEAFYAGMGLKRRGEIRIPMGPALSFPAVLMEGPLTIVRP